MTKIIHSYNLKTLKNKSSFAHVVMMLLSGFFSDCKKMSIPVGIIRLLRASKLLYMPQLRKQLLKNAAYQKHINKINKDDAIFFLSHQHYLARNLTSRQRAKAALFHYEHEVNSFDEEYFNAVYDKNGLTLWRKKVDDDIFDIRLMPGNDVLYEGGCSLVFHINDGRICVISYSVVEKEIFSPTSAELINENPPIQSILFVTRKQLTGDHSYQKVFNKAFDRTTPAHLCLGALTAIALAQGYHSFLGISPKMHPSLKIEYQRNFDVAYTQFWDSLNGQAVSPYGHLIELPMQLTALEELDVKARKRAIARRQHIDDVYNQAYEIMRKHLMNPLAIAFVSLILDLDKKLCC